MPALTSLRFLAAVHGVVSPAHSHSEPDLMASDDDGKVLLGTEPHVMP